MPGLGEAPITSYFSRIRTPRTRKENGNPSFVSSLKRPRDQVGGDEETSKPLAKRVKRRESQVLQSVADNKEFRVTREPPSHSDSVPDSRESSLTPPPISTLFKPRLCTLGLPKFSSVRPAQSDIIDLTSEVARIPKHPTPESRLITGQSSLQTPPPTNPRLGAPSIRPIASARFQPRRKSAYNLPTPVSVRRVSKRTKSPRMEPSLPVATPSPKVNLCGAMLHSPSDDAHNDLPTTPRSSPFPRDTSGGDPFLALSRTPVPSSQTFDIDSYYSHLLEANPCASSLPKRVDPSVLITTHSDRTRTGSIQDEDECIPSSQTQYYPSCGESFPNGPDLPRSSTVILDNDTSPTEQDAYELVASSQSQIERELSFSREGSPHLLKRPMPLSALTSPSKPRFSQRTGFARSNSRYKGPALPLARTESDEIFSLPTRNMSFAGLFHQDAHNRSECEVEAPKPDDALDDSATESESGDEFFTSRPNLHGVSPTRTTSRTTNSTPRKRLIVGRSSTAPPSPESYSTYSSFPDFVKDFRDMFNEDNSPRDSPS